MQNAGLVEVQAGIKIAGRNINKFIYADDTTLTQKAKRLLMKVKEESEKAGLKQPSKYKDHGIWFHHFRANRWGSNGNCE